METIASILWQTWEIFFLSAPFIVLGLLVGGLLYVLISRRMVERWMGGGGMGAVTTAAALGIPTLGLFREFVAEGALLSYGPNLFDLFRKAAGYVDKVLKGTKPADLPIEQPTAFDFVLNLKTAQALGLTIPPAILQQATEIIQ